MPRIQQLSSSIVNKIAAGEVIERPASVVKELLENAVDAGASRIDLVLEKGGGELIRVVDDGCGIAAEELPLAVASHATSKIRSAEDLFSVQTLGFRGEALASIAEVSRLVIRSRTPEADCGAQLEMAGGAAHPEGARPAGCPVGTTIEVRDLFFNTPVRHKFLRSGPTEAGHSIEAFTRIALAHPQIHFTLTHNGKPVHDMAPTADLRERVRAFFGDELAGDLISVASTSDGVSLSGYVANPMHTRAHGRQQYLFLNGRAIRDRALSHALCEAYRGLILTGRQPICFLRLNMLAELVDVNVHPTKQEVRFQDSGRIYSQLLGTLRTRFLTSDLTARGVASAGQGGQPSYFGAGEDADAERSQLVDWAKQQLGPRMPRSDEPNSSDQATAAHEPLRLHRFDLPEFKRFSDSRPGAGLAPKPAPVDAGRPDVDLASGRFAERSDGRPPNALQVHNRYLVVETGAGIEVIDQHALHERILYEQLRERVLAGAIESQKLLVPEPVDLSAAEAAAVLEEKEMLARLGVDVQPFGGDTVLVASYPAMLANMSPAEVLRELVERLVSESRKPEARDLLDELLHMIACKAAVKFGDRLAPEEIEALLAQRHLAQDTHHCPHGRPTALVFTREELDRQFQRI